jgi:predicted SAM-dependent methyltransferase
MGDGIRLHLGCGKRYLPGYVHIDVADYPHIDHRHDIRHLSMCADNSADVIYSCGAFEYLDRQEAVAVLGEWRRVLRPGGLLRMSVPDFEGIVEVYLQNGRDLDGKGIMGPLFGRIEVETPAGSAVLHHKTVYDLGSLRKLLEDCDFRNIRKYRAEDVLPPGYDDYSLAYMPRGDQEKAILMALNVECEK